MGDIKIFIWLQINSFTINYTLQCQKRAKKFSNDAKIHISLSFLLWRTKKIKWNWRKFLAVSLTNVFLPFSFYKFTFQSWKKTISEVTGYTCADNLFADKPKNVGCESHDLQINPILVLFSRHLEARINKSSISFRGIRRKFLDNICSEDDLRPRIFGTFVVKFLACLPLLGFSNI